MEIDHDVHVIATALARRGHQRFGLLQRGNTVERGSLAHREDFYRGETVGARLRRPFLEGVAAAEL